MKPDAKREAVKHLLEKWRLSERRACSLVHLPRKTNRYRCRTKHDEELRRRMRELAAKYPRYGSPRLYWLLRNEGLVVNHKRIERLYREERLALRKRRRRRLCWKKEPLQRAVEPNECWSLDFIFDRVVNGGILKMLTIVDNASRQCPGIVIRYGITGRGVARELERIACETGLPKRIRVDNGPEFRSRAFRQWCERQRITLEFIQPGKPTQNAFIESFNGKLREECLDQQLFFGLNDARQKVEQWRLDYNTTRPHRALGGMPLMVFLQNRLRQSLEILTFPPKMSALPCRKVG